MDSYMFSSIQGTIESIRMVLKSGRINDAYALLRKYYDSAIINIYSNLYLEDNFSVENLAVAQIDDWLKGKSQLPEYRVMIQYIRSCARLSNITAVLSANDSYKLLRDRCNSHTHYNYYQTVLLNDNEIWVRGRGRALDQFVADLLDIAILHVAYLFSTSPHYMMASDYVECLECGMEPEADSQYWVAPFIQRFFDDVVGCRRADVAAVVKANTIMRLT
jgi:hypothetical protein